MNLTLSPASPELFSPGSPPPPVYSRPPPSPVPFKGFDHLHLSPLKPMEIGKKPTKIISTTQRIEHVENRIRIIGEYVSPKKKSPPYTLFCISAIVFFVLL